MHLTEVFYKEDIVKYSILPLLSVKDLTRTSWAFARTDWNVCVNKQFQHVKISSPIILNSASCTWLLQREVFATTIILNVFSSGDDVLPYLEFASAYVRSIQLDRCTRLKLANLRQVFSVLSTSERIVDISVIGCSNASLFAGLIRGRPNLRVLSIAQCNQLICAPMEWLAGLNGALATPSDITSLTLHSASAGVITDAVVEGIAQVCAKVQALQLEGCADLSDKALEFVGDRCRDLRSVVIHNCPRVTDVGVAALCNPGGHARTTAVNLHTLTLSGCDLTARSVTKIAAFAPLMCDLDVNFRADMGVAPFEDLFRNCPKLRSLRLNWEISRKLAEENLLLRAASLESVVVREYTNILNVKLAKQIARQLTRARRLEVDLGARYANAALKNMVGRVCALPCPDTGALTYCGNLNRLTHVTLHGCGNVQDGPLVDLINCNEALHEIALHGASRVTNAVLEALAGRGGTLRSVALPDSPLIDDDGLCSLACACPHLQHIDLSGSLRLTDTGVIGLSDSCAQLVSVVLSNCDLLTETSLLCLGRQCRRLQYLYINCECRIGEDDYEFLVQSPRWRPLEVHRLSPEDREVY
jgi:hypothetical protein